MTYLMKAVRPGAHEGEGRPAGKQYKIDWPAGRLAKICRDRSIQSTPHHRCLIINTSPSMPIHRCLFIFSSSSTHRHRCLIIDASSAIPRHRCLITSSLMPLRRYGSFYFVMLHEPRHGVLNSYGTYVYTPVASHQHAGVEGGVGAA